MITGGLQVTGGSIGIGNVLTSDAFGNAIWQAPVVGSNDWSLTGNAGTIDGVNFIGTTDNVPFNIRVNNQTAGRMDPSSLNTFYGQLSGSSITSGIGNTGIGYWALKFDSKGNHNTALGSAAMLSNTTGDHNTGIGVGSLEVNTSGSYNGAFGYGTLNFNQTGNYNTAVGYGSLTSNIDGERNTGVGYQANVASSNLSNATAVGSQASVNASNKIRLGDVNVTVIEGQPAFYTGSDGRFKTNISEVDVKGLEFIKLLRPVVYNFDTRRFEEFLTKNLPDSSRKKYLNQDFSASTTIRRSGFIAQEVEKAANEVGYNFDGLHKPENESDNYSLAYGQFVVPLVKAVQELSAQNDILKSQLQDLSKKLDELVQRQSETSKSTSSKNKIINDAASLEQNAPNPFTNNTVIRYKVPLLTNTAQIVITDVNGLKLKVISLNNRGQGEVAIGAGTLSPGAYIYSLIIDGKKVESKQMILTK